jgi:hypothetical protein
MRADTGRNKCSKPNLQNLPAHGDLAKLVKENISVPDVENYYLGTFDSSSLQVRIAGLDTNLNDSGRDKNLYQVYQNENMEDDLHSLTAWSIFCAGQLYDLSIVNIILDGGETREYFADELITLKSGKKIYAKNLKEGDEIL